MGGRPLPIGVVGGGIGLVLLLLYLCLSGGSGVGIDPRVEGLPRAPAPQGSTAVPEDEPA